MNIVFPVAKISNREKLLTHGLRVVHERGLGGASVRDIVTAAGVPQGSFSNHFDSKEAFGLEIIELYFKHVSKVVADTLRNDARRPFERLGGYIATQVLMLKRDQMRNGCLLGNVSAESSEHGEAVRARIADIFTQQQASIAYCLQSAVEQGELSPDRDVNELAAFILSSLQGAILMSKALRSAAPIERFSHVLFSSVLS